MIYSRRPEDSVLMAMLELTSKQWKTSDGVTSPVRVVAVSKYGSEVLRQFFSHITLLTVT